MNGAYEWRCSDAPSWSRCDAATHPGGRGHGPDARRLEAAPRDPDDGRRAALAVLLLGGGRVSATGAMLWRDVDLANGRFEVGRDTTDAGMREVDMLPLLPEILTEHKAASDRTGPDDPVFVTSAGRPRSRTNIRKDVVEAAVSQANRLVAERGLQPLPLGITPHKLGHTFASTLVVIGRNPTYVM